MNRIPLFSLSIALLLLSCSSPNKNSDVESTATSATKILNEVSLTNEQFNAIHIELGSVEKRNISGNIKANGMLDVPPQNLVSVSAPLGGFVKSTDLLQGMHVNKGQIIVVMEHPNYIQLQQDYLESAIQLSFLEQEYNRQLDLSIENVNALKSLQQAKSNYFGAKAKVHGLKARLKLVNINPTDIENGEIKSTVNITTPISGFVSQVNVNIGMHVNPTDIMFRIVDTEHVHAEAQVFEKDIPKLKIGQVVRVTLSNETKERLAKVFLIGKEITAERTVRVHCHFAGEDENLIPGTYFSALIETSSNSVAAVPNSALVNFEGKTFVFVLNDSAKHLYSLMGVKAGPSDNGFVEIDFNGKIVGDFNNKIVVKGSFELLNVLRNLEE